MKKNRYRRVMNGRFPEGVLFLLEHLAFSLEHEIAQLLGFLALSDYIGHLQPFPQ